MEKYKKRLDSDYLFNTEYKEVLKWLKKQVQNIIGIDFERTKYHAIGCLARLTHFVRTYHFILITHNDVIGQSVVRKLYIKLIIY